VDVRPLKATESPWRRWEGKKRVLVQGPRSRASTPGSSSYGRGELPPQRCDWLVWWRAHAAGGDTIRGRRGALASMRSCCFFGLELYLVFHRVRRYSKLFFCQKNTTTSLLPIRLRARRLRARFVASQLR
jgi:hypothetical protein